MGESKRRKSALREKYGQDETILPWLPIKKSQADDFYKWTTKGAWIGIGLMVFLWVTVRFIGPTFGWWNVQ
ncbi:DUF2839 domain-containing protein [Aphanothece sacrum]|uniref:DUF2839 domain-containing protein n=1 Tax=Aphanothece sacrum FPU1 TaxID=1920663 RepID=A0A401IFP0_APHSA|nr:DUF2839 domain-containing protein [Aphanothece sacrum]GBF80102.1 hypothetical protein AsFPU1_1503 [Aphanothece sacrum FPU1]GBF86060.1 hypothetical protein AsFPU3_3130 [Aphanothece sacrum FPU3]